MCEVYKRDILQSTSREALKRMFGIIDDEAKIYLTILKLKKFYVDNYIDYGNEEGYYIVFNMKTKVLIDSLFENSRDYMIQSRCMTDPEDDRMMLLDIYDLVNIYAPFDT